MIIKTKLNALKKSHKCNLLFICFCPIHFARNTSKGDLRQNEECNMCSEEF